MSSQEGIHYLSNPLNHFTPLSFYVIIINVKLIVNVYACMLSCFTRVQLFVTLWTVACQAPLSVGFSRQEYWSGSSFPSPGDLPNPGTEPMSLMSPALAGGFYTTSTTWEAWGVPGGALVAKSSLTIVTAWTSVRHD